MPITVISSKRQFLNDKKTIKNWKFGICENMGWAIPKLWFDDTSLGSSSSGTASLLSGMSSAGVSWKLYTENYIYETRRFDTDICKFILAPLLSR